MAILTFPNTALYANHYMTHDASLFAVVSKKCYTILSTTRLTHCHHAITNIFSANKHNNVKNPLFDVATLADASSIISEFAKYNLCRLQETPAPELHSCWSFIHIIIVHTCTCTYMLHVRYIAYYIKRACGAVWRATSCLSTHHTQAPFFYVCCIWWK